MAKARGISDTVQEPAGYGELLEDLKSRIRGTQVRAAVALNRELIGLYWDIGRAIVERQRRQEWGSSVIERLSRDLRAEFPGSHGFSPRNLWRMRALFVAYGDSEFLPQPVAEFGETPRQDGQRGTGLSILPHPVAELDETPRHDGQRGTRPSILPHPVADLDETPRRDGQRGTRPSILPQPVAELDSAPVPDREWETKPVSLPRAVGEIPWSHNIVLLEKLRGVDERLWYAEMSARHGWSRNVLVHQIDSRLYTRTGRAVTNFARTLPAPQSDLARELLKDPYHFGFLQLGADAQERDLERALLANVRDFLMELGLGFALVGSQYHLEVGGQDYYLDLLFFHVRLRCYVVVELKIGAFQPEDAGKMNFYLAAVDDLVREKEHRRSIGLILCKERNGVVVEYALRGTTQPIGVAEFRTTEELPEQMRESLPSVEEIEARLGIRKD
ncbi:MAG TPA: PDDEXK nuclease domain-containing protein [Longimicrobium sp.]|nr:PDDEXK nuclease domain-containing protein [Longimicrobium sp.]